MKKAVVTSILSAVSLSAMLGVAAAPHAFGQQQVNINGSAQQAQAGKVQLSEAEYADYNNAINQTDPKAKAAAIEAYLTKYPQSSIKADMLQQLVVAYSSFDGAKTMDAGNRLLQVDPNNIPALVYEVYFTKASADTITDPAAKQAALDSAATYAQKGLAATKGATISDADFATLQKNAFPSFYSAIATAALNKKDSATAITNFTNELKAVPVAQTQAPGPVLQDTYFLGLAYLQSTPPDYVNCTYFVTRFTAFAPEPYKSQIAPTAKYCYRKFHGNEDGYDAVVIAASANLFPPAGFSIVPAPKASDIAHQTVASTSDLATLALPDKEFILTNGSQEDADKVFNSVKGKAVEIPGATVLAATDTQLQVAVSDDAVQTKTADFTFNLKTPLKTVPALGSTVTVTGTYASYTQTPLMITMSDAEVTPAKKTPATKAPVRKSTAPARRAGH